MRDGGAALADAATGAGAETGAGTGAGAALGAAGVGAGAAEIGAAVDGIDDDAADDDDDGDAVGRADAAAGADAVAAVAAEDAPNGATWAPADDAGPADDDDFFFWSRSKAFGVARFSRLSASLLSAAVGRFPAQVGGTTNNSSTRNFSGRRICQNNSRCRSRPARL